MFNTFGIPEMLITIFSCGIPLLFIFLFVSWIINKNKKTKRKCPYCAEEILAEATFCRYCQKDLPQYRPPPQNSARPWGLFFSSLSLITWIFPLIGFPVSIIAIIKGFSDNKKFNQTITFITVFIAIISLLATAANSIAGSISGYSGTLFNYASTATLIPTRTPRPTYTPHPNILTQEAEGIAGWQTAVAEANGIATSQGCIKWDQVSAQMAGKTVCAYGVIYEVYRTNDSFTRVKFSSQPNTFFMHSTNFYYTDPDTGKEMGAGDCIQNTATIELYSGIPNMKITDPKKCN